MSDSDRIELERYIAGDMSDEVAARFLEKTKRDPEALKILGQVLVQQSLICDIQREESGGRSSPRAHHEGRDETGFRRILRLPHVRIGLAASILVAAITGALVLRGESSAPRLRARVVETTYEVFLRRGGAELPVDSTTRIQGGDSLRTTAGAVAVVEYDGEDTRIELRGHSVASFESSASGKRVSLGRGSLSAEVAPQLAGRAMVLTTPHAEATVIGTKFVLEAEADSTRLEVEEGVVGVVLRDSEARGVDVKGGEFIATTSGAPLFVRSLSDLGSMRRGTGKTYYVDQKHPAAADDKPGNSDEPFATIGRAVEVVKPGDTVLIRPGIYREAVELNTSGTSDAPITFAAARPGEAIISGADVLTGWVQASVGDPVHSVPWPHDFIIDRTPDGEPVRAHGAPAPIGCAEQILWNGRALAQVMRRNDLRPGHFYVDWDEDRLHVWLSGGVSPDTGVLEGCVREYLMGPRRMGNQLADAEHIHARGIIFRHAANFAQRGGVVAGTNWRYQDCVVEYNSATGMRVEGDHAVLLRVVSQDNGFNGIGGRGRNILVKDCVTRRNNRRGYPPGWDGGGGKWVGTRGLRITGLRSYSNLGAGLWLDHDNTDFAIEGCEVFANIGDTQAWQGPGIYIEINPGPGRISGNVIYSNTGAGIAIAESRNVIVEGNTLVDNQTHISFRAMERTPGLGEIAVRNNSFALWRAAAFDTSLGEWSARSAVERSILMDANVYEVVAGLPIAVWGGVELKSLDEIESALGMEKAGRAGDVYFARDLLPTVTREESVRRSGPGIRR